MTQAKSMEDLVSLCKRRGFVYPASEIYGGLNGFWDYGPLGTQLKNNLRDAWWQDMVLCPPTGPGGQPLQIVGLDSAIIQNPRVWEASGHVAGFNDPMIDCRQSKARYRADQLRYLHPTGEGEGRLFAFIEGDEKSFERALKLLGKYVKRDLGRGDVEILDIPEPDAELLARTVGPDATEPGTLTEPRPFNLMFPTIVGATGDWEENKAYLRPETAQGIFINFKHVMDTTRVKVPFGIAQVGKSFRNEVTPRNFIFRSREFEQMEMEWFCHPGEAREWFEFWRDQRLAWWKSIGLTGEDLRLRQHESDELSHYAKEGVGTADVEYRYPFTHPDFGELEGVAHRTDFDLRMHQEHSGQKLEVFDQERRERYLPHVIEPAAGLTRGMLAVLCEAYTRDESRPSPEIMRFHPRLAPIKAAVFPLVNKEGMPEIAERLVQRLRARFGRFGMIETDAKQSIGKRYARMDEAGCPFCFTVDGETVKDQTVTVRDRDTGAQERIAIERVESFLSERLGL